MTRDLRTNVSKKFSQLKLGNALRPAFYIHRFISKDIPSFSLFFFFFFFRRVINDYHQRRFRKDLQSISAGFDRSR